MRKLIAVLFILLILPCAGYAGPNVPSTTATTINGATLPASKAFVGTNSSSQIIDASTTAATSSVLGLVKPDGTSILNTTGAISATAASVGAQAAGTTQGSMTCLSFGSMSTCQYAGTPNNNGTITLPTATAGWPLRCEIETGDDADSALFTVTSAGVSSPISSSAGIVFNLATASKVQVGAVAAANPLVITNASGGALNIWVACKFK